MDFGDVWKVEFIDGMWGVGGKEELGFFGIRGRRFGRGDVINRDGVSFDRVVFGVFGVYACEVVF